jgi:acylaminoacyl-peptidase
MTTKPSRSQSSAARKRAVRPEDLLRFLMVSDPQIAPDGSSIVFVRKHVNDKNEYVANLWMASTSLTSNVRQFTSGGKDSRPRWSPDGQRIAFIGGREKTRPQLYVIGATGGEALALTSFPEGSIGEFCWSPNGAMLAVGFRDQHQEWTEDATKRRKEKGLSDPPHIIDDWWYRLDGDGYFINQRYRLYLVDAATGKHRVIYKDVMGGFRFDFSPDSRSLVISTNRDKKAMIRPWKSELVILTLSSGKVRPIPNLPEGSKGKVKWSPDGKQIAYVGREGQETWGCDNLQLYVCSPNGGAKSLTGKEDYCLTGAILSDSSEVSFDANFHWTPDSRRLFMQLDWNGASQIASVSAKGGRIQLHSEGERIHTPGNLTADGRKMALLTASSTTLDEVHVSPVAERLQTTALTNFNGPLFKELDLAKPKPTWVKAADGWPTQVWVMKPTRSNGKSHPAVLEIHGGPHAQYGVGYFHEFQCLAAAGYVVVYSNPRGSKGYGEKHCEAIRGAWGAADWADIQAVTRFMQGQPYINRKRMGVMGGSYGGYMTNWVIGHTHDFAAAITDRCVSNLVSEAGNSDFVSDEDQYWEGNFWSRPEARWNQSPIKYFSKVKTPALIIHSAGDLRCNIEQAEQVFYALKLLNVPTRFIRYPASTSHGMSRGGPPDLRIHRLTQILTWWKERL